MKKQINKLMAIAVACVAVYSAFGGLLYGAGTDIEAGDLRGSNVENATFSVSSDGYIMIIFGNRPSTPSFSAGTVLADTGTSGGVFAGDYIASGISKLGFRIRSEFDVSVPVAASVVLYGSSGRKWYNKRVEVSKTGGLWVPNNIGFDLSSGWNRDGGGDKNAMWDEDIRSVTGIGIRLSQVGINAQSYSVGTFILLDDSGKVVGESGLLPARVMEYFSSVYGVSSVNDITEEMRSKDSDGDGMSDWLELLAGTDPNDRNSVFVAKITNFSADGITIRWPVISDGVYNVMKKEGWASDFTVVSGDVYPDAEDIASGFINYKDNFTPGRGPYFYKILKK